MTNQEAITWLTQLSAGIEWELDMSYAAALDMAIEALKAYEVPSAQPDVIRCKDCKYLTRWRSEEYARKFGQAYECMRGVFASPKPDDYCSHAKHFKTMQELPCVQPEPQWILCSERNPEHGGWYIVTKNLTDDGDKAVCLSWYSLHGWEWGEAPIAWMPLPEPFKGGGKDATRRG